MKPTYEQLEQTILDLQRAILALRAEIEQLKARLNKNSGNSSKAPSSDQKSNNPKPDPSKKQGPSHAGASRQLLPQNMVTSRETRGVDTCPRCRSRMEPTGESVKWQQVDLPQIKPLVHEIELLTCKCMKCALTQTPTLKDHETFLMGPRLEGFVNLLMAQFRHSHLAVRTFIPLLIPGLYLSQGLISKAKKRGAQAFDQALTHLTEEVLTSVGPKYADVTGWRHMAQNWNALIVRSPVVIRYFLIPKQNGTFLADTLQQGPHFLVSDRGLATQKVNTSHLQYCLAHFLRNIRGMAENTEISLEETQALGEIHETLQELFHEQHRYKQAEISLATWRQYGYKKWAWMRQAFEGLWGSSASGTLKRFCKRALADWKHFMIYLAQDGPMTNNLAEEGLRNLVIARKLCFGSRSEYGLKWREAIQSCVETLKRQSKSVIDFFAETIQAFRTGASHPRIV
jgi:transposase